MTGEYSFSDIVKALDIYELLRCKAAPAILKHSESADSKCNYSEPKGEVTTMSK